MSDDAGKVSGGFVGTDWTSKADSDYKFFGIEHKKNFFSPDEYYRDGKKLTKRKLM